MLFQGRFSLFHPKNFLFQKKPDRKEKHCLSIRVTPGYLFRSDGWLSVMILHSEGEARRALEDQRKNFRRKIVRFFFM